ncbi:unnamed protein product [Adineta ricciae]|uniref:Uncharacterized protein n=1 Tax=Adineta ricciae TaxID=249248 RepID=A0A813VRH0_ADIRI|nr:unnamed protein product [Adineta ricciae]CAF1500571.1 unnamed protein product [Adineta ricciae]
MSSMSSGTNFTRWSEDDWIETRFSIQSKFVFNRQRYENLVLRTRMNEWSLELSHGNSSRLNRLWTEMHIFLRDRTSLQNSTFGHIRNLCNPPVISPLTNDSNARVPELTEMDQRIAQYFIIDGFFRTINYIHCKIDERRREPSLHLKLEMYLVTNRDFQSLVYFEMSEETYKILYDRQARFYIHSHERNFRYNFNLSQTNYSASSDTGRVYMTKLYNQVVVKTSNAMKRSVNVLYICIFAISLVSIQ